MKATDSLIWSERHFCELTSLEVYQLARLRINVFVLEQRCPYAELDGRDIEPATVHVFAKAKNTPVAYARILLPAEFEQVDKRSEPEAIYIGRVVVAKPHRQRGVARSLMQRVLALCENRHPASDQALSAQVQVKGFYMSLGFNVCSNEYLEDGIAHVDMRRQCNSGRG